MMAGAFISTGLIISAGTAAAPCVLAVPAHIRDGMGLINSDALGVCGSEVSGWCLTVPSLKISILAAEYIGFENGFGDLILF